MKLARQFKDLGIEGIMARWYDNNTRKHRMGEMKRYAGEIAARINKGSEVLDVAPGPGYLAIELARLGRYKIRGLDISRDFIDIAEANAKEAGVSVEFMQGNASRMPYTENVFDFIICTAAFKNFREPLAVLQEMHRVLKKHGTALIIDLKSSVSNREIEELLKSMGVRGAEKLFMKLTFKYFLRKGAYSKQELIDLAMKSNFHDCRITEEGTAYHVYLHKQ